MIFLFYFLFLVSGYAAGFLIRRIFSRLSWGNTSCNIQKKGILSRALGGLLIILIALYFHIPSLMLVAGFMWYESRAKWCIVRNFQP